MALAERAIPAEETDIIAKTVIHPNISPSPRHTSNFYIFFPPMRFSPGDFHFTVATRKACRTAGVTGKVAIGFADGVVTEFPVSERNPSLLQNDGIGLVFFNFLLSTTSA
jgi:hypothetical protein